MHWGMGDVETESGLVLKVFSCNGKKRIEGMLMRERTWTLFPCQKITL